MALSIKNEKADRLVRELTAITGESLTEAIVISLEERLEKKRRERARTPAEVQARYERLRAIADECAKLPRLTDLSPDEILYDEYGLPH